MRKLWLIVVSFSALANLLLSVALASQPEDRQVAQKKQTVTIEQLIAQDKLQINVEILSAQPIIAKQAVVISVELMTDRWFAAGNKIHDFEMDNVIKLPLDSQAINSSLRYQNKQWATQTREITLYPVEAGHYELPPIILDIAVNTPNGVVKGTTKTDAMSFTAILPKPLSSIEQFVVTDDFSVTSRGHFEGDASYKIGEAVTLDITITAQGVPAMMLPLLPELSMAGVNIYQKKPQLIEKKNRGELVSQRIEQLNFVFEQPGEYVLPESTFYWWNISSNQLEQVTLPSQHWTVVDEVISHEQVSKINFITWLGSVEGKQLLQRLVFGLLIALLIKLIYQQKGALLQLYRQLSHYEQRQLSAKYMKAIKAKQYRLACQYLYALIPYLSQTHQGIYWQLAYKQHVQKQYFQKQQGTKSAANDLLTLVPPTLAEFYRDSESQSAIVRKITMNGFGHEHYCISITEAKQLLKVPLVNLEASKSRSGCKVVSVNPR